MSATPCKTCRGFGSVVMAPSTTSAGGEQVNCPACKERPAVVAATFPAGKPIEGGE